jgi:hypothetical protein
MSTLQVRGCRILNTLLVRVEDDHSQVSVRSLWRPIGSELLCVLRCRRKIMFDRGTWLSSLCASECLDLLQLMRTKDSIAQR